MIKFHVLASSSKGNSMLIESEKTRILVDCGISCKRICTALENIAADPKTVDAILITHEHSDHISGLRVFSSKYHTPVYSGEATLKCLSAPGSDMIPVSNGREFTLGDITVTPFDLPHDAAQPLGYMFMHKKRKFAVATDMGRLLRDIAYILKDSNFVFIESNHDKEMLMNGGYPYSLKQRITGAYGHLSNEQCAKLITALAREGTKRFMLGHLSLNNNTPSIAYETNAAALRENGFSDETELKVACGETPSEVVYI